MIFASVTRLRLRSVRFLPEFALLTFRSLRQVRRAAGFRGGSLLLDRGWAFWTMTAWDVEESMRRYMMEGSHRAAMPRLVVWCDEASVAHWTQDDDALPGWTEAARRMREGGRPSKLRHPGPAHAGLCYREPRTTVARAIRPVPPPSGPRPVVGGA